VEATRLFHENSTYPDWGRLRERTVEPNTTNGRDLCMVEPWSHWRGENRLLPRNRELLSVDEESDMGAVYGAAGILEK